MPEYKQNSAGAGWLVARSWDGIREILEEHGYGQHAAGFIVRTSAAQADEARADEHPKTKAVFLARPSPGTQEAADPPSGGPQPVAPSPSAGEASTPGPDAMELAESAEALEEMAPSPDDVPERAAEPGPKEAPRSRASVTPYQRDSGGKRPARPVVLAAVLVVAAIAGTLLVLPRIIDLLPIDPQVENPQRATADPIDDRESEGGRLVQQRQAQEAAARRERELESRVQALQAQLEAVERGREAPPPGALATQDKDAAPGTGGPFPLLEAPEDDTRPPAYLTAESEPFEGQQIAPPTAGIGEQPPDPIKPIAVADKVVKPVRVKYVEPRYPSSAARRRVEGTVELKLTIDTNGDVTDVEVVRGRRAGLTEAATTAVRKWKYEPATLNGRPVAAQQNVAITFRL